MLRLVTNLSLALLIGLLFASVASSTEYVWETVLQSPNDETFFGIGDSRNKFDPDNVSSHPISVDSVMGTPKRNGGYVWGLTSYKDDIWYGINDNGWCDWLVPAGVPMFGQPAMGKYGLNSNSVFHTYLTDIAACSHEPNENRKEFTRFYYFNTKSKVLTRIKSDNAKFIEHSMGTLAIRSAGRYGNVVFLAGLRSDTFYSDSPELAVFAFNADTHQYIDSTVLKGFANIRRMQEFTHPDGSSAFYLSAGNETGKSNYENYLLRWVGTEEQPFVGGGSGTKSYIKLSKALSEKELGTELYNSQSAALTDEINNLKTSTDYDTSNSTDIEATDAQNSRTRNVKVMYYERIDGFNVALANYGEETGLYSEIEPYTDLDGNSYIVMTTWHSATKSGGLYISEKMPPKGFAYVKQDGSVAAPAKFKPIMLMNEFEPDPVLGNQWFTGFLSIYHGYAYWGTMATPASYATVIGTSLRCNYGPAAGACTALAGTGPGGANIDFSTGEVIDHKLSLCTGSEEKVRACLTNGIRAAQVFRTKLDGEDIKTLSAVNTEMLYGDEYFTIINPMSFTYPTGLSWIRAQNKLGMKPKYGPAGITSRSNVYAWASAVYNDKLYFGTMDISNGQRDYLESSLYREKYSQPEFELDGKTYKGWVPHSEDVMPIQAVYDYYRDMTIKDGRQLVDGGDFLVFEDEKSAAKLISDDAMGNPNLTGFRNFTVLNGELYLGTTGMANLGENTGYAVYKFTPIEEKYAEIKSSSGGCSVTAGSNSNILGIIILSVICIAAIKSRRSSKN